MANPANSTVQNLLPVQAYFSVDGEFQTFIGQGVPFTATIGPDQSGLNITNSTINSTTIGATSPSTAVFSSGQVLATPSGNTDLANKLYVDSVASGLSWKQPFQVATTVNLTTLSGFPVIDTYQTVVGSRVLVKNQTNAAENGIYVASSGTWAYAADGDTWNEYISAIGFIEYGSQASSAWYCSAQSGGTLGVTNMNWSNFSVAGTYFAGTGLTLAAYTFSITNTGVTAGNYGTDARSVTLAINAQGQITSAVDQPIAIANTQVSGLGTMSTQNANSVAITGGTINGTAIGGTTAAAVTGTTITAGTQFTGAGTGLTGTATSLSIGGTAATATNIAGGAAGSLPYQSAANTTALLAAGTNGQVLTLASGVPSWATPTVGTVTSVSGTGTVNGLTLTGTVTSSGSLTLGGTLDLSSPPAIGGTAANTINGTTITASTALKSPYLDATTSAGGALRNASGTACFQWGSGGGANCTVDTSININGTNAQVDISPTGTGHVHMNPTGSGSIEMNPTSAGVMNNMVIGGTTPLAGTFTNLRVNGTISLAGSTGTSGYAIISNGASAPTWQAITQGITITDDTSTNATRYLTFTSATSGTVTGLNTGSTELSWNPSTGILNLSGSTGGLVLPVGTTAQRPSPVAGMTRFNSTTADIEFYTGTSWVAVNYTSPPSNTAAPVISGALVVGSTLTSTTGSWTNSPTSYTYQWYAGASPISGATSSTFVTTSGEVGSNITCQVVAANIAGTSSAATSNSLGPIITAVTVTYLAIGGGGAGGGYYGNGGGGGAGGLLNTTAAFIPGTQYTLTVGAGGVYNGSNSTITGSGFTTLTLVGGGSGGNNGGGGGDSGGSGGGGGGGGSGGAGGAGTAGQGNNGGAGNGGLHQGGGGGGAGSYGQGGGAGGAGGSGAASSITGTSVTYAGGGGSSYGSGGSGGGGSGGYGGGGSAGATNTGSGGGGGNNDTGTDRGYGGSGLIILSVPTAQYTGTYTGSPTITTSGSNTILKYTSTGTYTA